jgi:hypothetical protein
MLLWVTVLRLSDKYKVMHNSIKTIHNAKHSTMLLQAKQFLYYSICTVWLSVLKHSGKTT